MNNSDSRHKVVMSLGSNTSDALHQMRQALCWCERELIDARNSGIYSTPPSNGKGGRYMNAVVEGYTMRTLSNLNVVAKDYELCSGRDEKCRLHGQVPIDIDIVVYDSEIVRPDDFRQSYFTKGFNGLHSVEPETV